jgi:hypothetical protein
VVKLLPRHRKVKGSSTAAPIGTGSEKMLKKSGLKWFNIEGKMFQSKEKTENKR